MPLGLGLGKLRGVAGGLLFSVLGVDSRAYTQSPDEEGQVQGDEWALIRQVGRRNSAVAER